MLIFAYGSLLDPALPARVLGPAVLPGWRRVWGVAMDNRSAIPGYKRYVDPDSGEAPAVCVVFLDVVPDGRSRVDGAIIEVDDALVPGLDRRERNYERVAVPNAGFERRGPGASGATVWAFVGRSAGRARCAAARRDGIAVVSRAYLERVRRDFDGLGMLAAFDASTDPPGIPVVGLVRVDVPGGAPRTAVEGVV